MDKKIFAYAAVILLSISYPNGALSNEGSAFWPGSPDATDGYLQKETARDLLSMAEKGNSKAQLKLGFMYEHGVDVAKNPSEAIKWYRMAADQGEVDAQFNLGLAYYKGDITAQNYSEAAAWFAKAAENGNEKAQLCLGLMYCSGKRCHQRLQRSCLSIQESSNAWKLRCTVINWYNEL